MKNSKLRIILHALIITSAVLTINLNVRGMLNWNEEKLQSILVRHETVYPFSLRPLTSEATRFLSNTFGLTVRQSFIAGQYSLLFVLLVSFDYLLAAIAFSKRRRIVGIWALGLSYPILCLHFIPNYTWDDLWGYIALIWMAVFLIRGHLYPAALCLAFVAIAKENQLVALPALFFFRDRAGPIRNWLIPFLIPPAVFVAYRILTINGIAHETFSMLSFNFSDIARGRQTLFSLLICFGALWVWAGEGTKRYLSRDLSRTPGDNVDLHRRLALSALVVSVATVASTLLLAKGMETRLFFTPFVFLIPLALITVNESKSYGVIREYVKSSSTVKLSLVALGFSAIGIFVSSLAFPNFPSLPEQDPHRWLFGFHLALVFFFFVAKSERTLSYFSVTGIITGIRKIPRVVFTLFAISLSLRVIFLVFVSANFTSETIWNLFPDTNVYLLISSYFHSSLPGVEYDLLLSGPGYGFIIYTLSGVVAMNGWAHIIVQIFISAATSVLIRRLALQLGLHSKVATVAGYIHAVSLTAISLSCSLLTETWYVFLSLSSLLLFLKAYKTDRTWSYLLFTFLAFATAMVRSIGFFHPLALGALLLLPVFRDRANMKEVLWRPLAFSALSLILIFGWATRNYVKHDIFTISETGVRAARLYWIASVFAPERTIEDINEVRMVWDGEIATRYGATVTPRERHDFDVSVVRDSLSRYPGSHIRSYAFTAWKNMTIKSLHQEKLVPQWKPLWSELSKRFLGGIGKYLVGLTLVGFVLLALCDRRRAAAFLLMFYALYALTSGITFWQSSRIFFPAEPFWTIGCATALVWTSEKSKRLINLKMFAFLQRKHAQTDANASDALPVSRDNSA